MDVQVWLTCVAAMMALFIWLDQPLFPQVAILIATFAGLAFFNALACVFLADRWCGTMRKPGVSGWITRAGATGLIVMGVASTPLRKAA